MDTKILLSLFGLRNIEIEIYEKLFYNGAMAASKLAQQVGLSRTSIYDLVNRLKKSGLVIETLSKGKKAFMVQPPEKIALLLESKTKELETAQKILGELEETYYDNRPQDKPRFQLFEGKETLQQMVKDLLLYHDITAQIFWSVNQSLELLSPKFFTEFHEKRIKSNIKLQAIWPKEPLPSSKIYPFLAMDPTLKREVRIAPSMLDFSLGYAIYANTVRFISSSKENFGFLIESQELANMLRSHFKTIWELSKPL